ncbi:MAG: carbamoyltransferase [Crenarchaeota archaeon]|nr:carbamoyltransferase [Thermoproteota archaeon]
MKAFLGYELPREKFVVVEHHLAHAATAYYFSGHSTMTVVTADGAGEYQSTVVWSVRDGEFEKVLELHVRDGSLGIFYEGVSYCIGFTEYAEGPGKAMGLAPYGKPNERYRKVMESLLKVYDEGADRPFELAPAKLLEGYYIPYLEKAGCCIFWNPRERPMNEEAADLAYELQRRFEEAYLTLSMWAKKHVGSPYLGLSGGVALNGKGNMVIHYSKIFSDVFIFPGANDAGISIGAAAWAYEHVLGKKMKNVRIRSAYWGFPYGEEEVRSALKLAKDLGFKVEEVGDAAVLAEDLVKGKFYAIYQGRAEFGPRALGHRSLVADPRKREHWERMNEVKGREWWRPLAPSLLLEDADYFFKDPVEAPFMILMLKYKDENKCREVPATCHVDMTARPQTVTREIDAQWYGLIKEFKRLTGIGLIMNTSFNMGGEPLVETPVQAVLSYAFMFGLSGLWLEGYLITK